MGQDICKLVVAQGMKVFLGGPPIVAAYCRPTVSGHTF